MLETIETLLQSLCTQVKKSSQSETQALYVLEDNQEAKLAYDVLVANGFDVKLYADDNSSRLYITRASLSSDKSEALEHAIRHANLLKQLKSILDDQSDNEYSLVFSDNPSGAHIGIQLIEPKEPSSEHAPAVSPNRAQPAPIRRVGKKYVMTKPEKEDVLGAGPAVARQIIPKSLVPEEQQEDTAFKRGMLFVTSQAFKGGSWVAFFGLCLGLIFSVLVLVRGFMCPDLAVARELPSYCKKVDTKKPNE
jgi:hypothetical protein